ncbi:transcription antitermination factor NusB [Acetomicrobium hydrogeniformans]|uniref:transcription antitermination factor NusB n=1 Tax=Acetomicrobium hydrogeniformans TaxID=649746 RepID=UPI0001BCA71F|nr:transcription antitermination factor NusB [Acetomicrobium hydrogeniformans]
MSLLQQQRRRAREIALQLLYALDIRNDQTPDEAMALFPFDGESEEVMNYAIWLVKEIWGKRVEIDNLIRMHITGWRPERMVTVDLEAIRLALFEGVYSKVVPIPVAISEAIELAKRFGTENSGRFVNGVLGKIVRSIAEVEGDGKDVEGNASA